MGIIMITEADKIIFEKYKDYYISFERNKYIKNYTKEVYQDLLSLYAKYVSPKHQFSHWCSSCRTELIVSLYRWYSINNQVLTEDVPQGTIEIEQVITEEVKVEQLLDTAIKKKGRKKKS